MSNRKSSNLKLNSGLFDEVWNSWTVHRLRDFHYSGHGLGSKVKGQGEWVNTKWPTLDAVEVTCSLQNRNRNLGFPQEPNRNQPKNQKPKTVTTLLLVVICKFQQQVMTMTIAWWRHCICIHTYRYVRHQRTWRQAETTYVTWPVRWLVDRVVLVFKDNVSSLPGSIVSFVVDSFTLKPLSAHRLLLLTTGMLTTFLCLGPKRHVQRTEFVTIPADGKRSLVGSFKKKKICKINLHVYLPEKENLKAWWNEIHFNK